MNKRKTEILFGWPDLLDGYDSAIGLLAFLQGTLVWVDSALKFDVKTSFFQLRLLSEGEGLPPATWLWEITL